MNSKHFSILAAAMISGLASGFSQDATPTPPTPPAPGQGGLQGRGMGEGRRMMRDKFLENMPAAVRQRFEAARDKAMQDPKIKELKESADKSAMELFKAMREKMLEIDPGLADEIKKMRGGDGGGKGNHPEGMRPDGGGPNNPGMASLTDAEREKLMAAREKAKADPAVVAADKKKDDATTPDERKIASEAYRKAMHDAILKVDPSLEPVLDKLAAAKPPAPPQAPTAPAPPKGGGDDEMNKAPGN
ncbi:hypothetical protein BH09VER1_BH09VER1_30230 [soil metagenome]